MKKKGSGLKKSVVEDLPPGWTKETRIKKKCGKTRKEQYYVDPESGQVFRSLKEVFRYLETKSDQGLNNMQAAGSSSTLPSEGEELKAVESKADDKQLGVDENLELVGKEEKVVMPIRTECCTSPPPAITCHHFFVAREEDSVMESSNMVGVNFKDGKSAECQLAADHMDKENEEVDEKLGNKTISSRKNKLRESKSPHLPIRVSKRLAGIKANPLLEPKTNSHQGLAVARQEDQTKDGITDTSIEDTPGSVKKQEGDSSSLGKLLSFESSSSPSLQMKDIWSDPCIEFAIKTLTGEIPCMGEEVKRVEETTPQSSLSSSAVNRQSSSFGAEVAAFGGGGGGIWADPCIEFAVKILTDEIPISSVDVSAFVKPSVNARQPQQGPPPPSPSA
ncbi:unnamed protein product [Cuscuta europaea]|uniref:MBD domain-containing protein n=1 Tax=Cuscuta europaea TaxID=41803 RepID=A0A9P0ZGG3_CUSEU|nr:unnamed protein product [Cuscuta europaea]